MIIIIVVAIIIIPIPQMRKLWYLVVKKSRFKKFLSGEGTIWAQTAWLLSLCSQPFYSAASSTVDRRGSGEGRGGGEGGRGGGGEEKERGRGRGDREEGGRGGGEGEEGRRRDTWAPRMLLEFLDPKPGVPGCLVVTQYTFFFFQVSLNWVSIPWNLPKIFCLSSSLSLVLPLCLKW